MGKACSWIIKQKDSWMRFPTSGSESVRSSLCILPCLSPQLKIRRNYASKSAYIFFSNLQDMQISEVYSSWHRVGLLFWYWILIWAASLCFSRSRVSLRGNLQSFLQLGESPGSSGNSSNSFQQAIPINGWLPIKRYFGLYSSSIYLLYIFISNPHLKACVFWQGKPTQLVFPDLRWKMGVCTLRQPPLCHRKGIKIP